MASLSCCLGLASRTEGTGAIPAEGPSMGVVLGMHCPPCLDLAAHCFAARAGCREYTANMLAAVRGDWLEPQTCGSQASRLARGKSTRDKYWRTLRGCT